MNNLSTLKNSALTQERPRSSSSSVSIDTNPYKQDFPLLIQHPNLAFLDSAATTQKPTCVLDAQRTFYETMNANPLRGLYSLSIKATEAVQNVRSYIAKYLGTQDASEIVFTRNTTESLNLVAHSFGSSVLQPGDEIAITIMEHHSNLLPWQQICRETGAKLVYLYPTTSGELRDEEIAHKIGPRTKIAAIAEVSNVLGVRSPVEKIAEAVHAHGGYLVVDAAQSIPHTPVSLKQLNADFLAFSAHKALGPMGVGVLWGRHELLERMEPIYTGGEMIDSVTTESAVWAPIPQKFEAGTQDAAGIYATGVALHYLFEDIGLSAISERETALVAYALKRMKQLPFIDILGADNPAQHHGIISFNVAGVHPHDVASILDMHHVAIRAGHHCAQPLLNWLEVENRACCRVSITFYNDTSDIDALINGLTEVHRLFIPYA